MRKFLFLSLLLLSFSCDFVNAQQNKTKTLEAFNNSKTKQFYIENKGQWDNSAAYLTRIAGLDGWVLKNGGMLLDFYEVEKNNKPPSKFNGLTSEQEDGIKKGHRILMSWINAKTELTFERLEKQQGYYNYLIGTDKEKHASNVGLYGEIEGKNIYNGIDLRYYHASGLLRYDLIVHPNANADQIKLKIQGADKIRTNEKGDIIIYTSVGELKMQDLYVYEKENKKQIECKWIINERNELVLSIGDYNKSNTLIIDPLIYSTYLGGNADDWENDIAVDSFGNAYVAGYSSSTNFDVTTGSYQIAYKGVGDAVITKLNSSGTNLIYSTYLGGLDYDEATGIGLDASSNVYITGYTVSNTFGVTNGAYQTIVGGAIDAFVCKLDPLGTSLIYSTYIGGNDNDYSYDMTLDAFDNVYITGMTRSADFDITSGAYQTKIIASTGSDDAFVAKINSSGTSLFYCTYLGGGGLDVGYGISVDGSGNAHVTGITYSSDYDTTTNAYQTFWPGGVNAFVTKLNPTGTGLIYSTYLGGTSDDFGFDIAVSTSGNAFVTGKTASTNFPTVIGSFQTGLVGNDDVFVTKLSLSGTSLDYSTYLGGGSEDVGYAIAVDNNGNAYITGYAHSIDFNITSGAFQTNNIGLTSDIFITKLNASGASLLYSTYVGGTHQERGYGIVVDFLGDVYVTGKTNSTDYDYTIGAYQTSLEGTSTAFDGIVLKIDICPPINLITTSNNVTCNGYSDGSATVSVSGGMSSYTYSWLPSGQTSQIATNLTAGTYTVTVSSNGCNSIKTITITQPSPFVTNISGANSVCSGQNIILTAGTGVSYNWSTGYTTSSITVSPSSVTTYSVIVSNGRCLDTAYATVNVVVAPMAKISGIDTICFGQSTMLTANGGGTYSWSIGSSNSVISVSPVSNTTYTLIVNDNGCSDTTQISIIVNPLPIASITGTNTICIGQNTILSANGGNTYSWNTGATTSSITVSPAANTSYTVTVFNIAGCSNTASQLITVVYFPSVSISGSAIICAGETVTLTATGVGSFLWSTGNTASVITATPTGITTYTVTASNSCGNASDTITVSVNPLPLATISNDTTILFGSSANLFATGGITYLWNPATGLSCISCSNPVATPQSTIIYFVTITDANGCSVTRSITITVDNNFEIFVPDIFSPNGDGQNDILFVRGTGIKELKFVVYDRLGEKIFESNNVNNGWDGTYKGSLLNNAVFVYYISATLINDKKIKTKGDVTLIR